MGKETTDNLIAPRFQLKQFEPSHPLLADYGPNPINTPSEWFSARFPKQSGQFGTPFLECKYAALGHADRVRALSINIDFFASILGGERRFGHDLVFYPPEETFYFLEPIAGYYVATTPEKLETLISQYFILCCQDLQEKPVDFEHIFTAHRKPEQLQAIVHKSKSLFACDDTFFFGSNANPRMVDGKLQDPNAEPPHIRFVHEKISFQKGATLLLKDLIRCFELYCLEKGVPLAQHRKLRADAYDLIYERFGLRLRKDLKDQEGKWSNGWRNLSIRQS